MRTLSLLLVNAAFCTAAVTPPDQLKVPPGFKVELLREAGPDEGSWICMTQDHKGRLYISTQGTPKGASTKDQGQWGGLWRTTIVMTENPTGNIQPHVLDWEKVNVPVGDAMGMLWAFDSLYVSGMGPQGRGIYRCKSSKGDSNLDTATLFKSIPTGAGEHGAHAIILGPDKKLYIVNGNSTGILDGLDPDSPYRHWGEDDLLPRLKDPVATFFDKLKAPYGCVYRTEADGTKWELFAGGFRNPYDIAFNADGELFTYDSDMEWDRGLPWYRPTRILHVVPGGEYGFREGSAKWPAYFPDSLPAAADIGVGCPTGIKFGTEAKGWPEKYRRALFLHDWTYGRILAVTLREKGASYTARNDLASYTYPRDAEANGDVEVFLSGKGMPVTDLEFLRDGSMVFTVGGRGTAAALYRVSWTGGEIAENKDELIAAVMAAGEGKMARMIVNAVIRGIPTWFTPEEFSPSANAPFEELGAAKFFADFAYRTALESAQEERGKTPLMDRIRGKDSKDRQRVLDPSPERDLADAIGKQIGKSVKPEHVRKQLEASRANAGVEIKGGRLLALLAVARIGNGGFQNEILEALKSLPLADLPDDLKLLKLRVLELSFARQGRPSEEWVKTGMEELLAHYPAPANPAAGGAGAPRTLPKADDKQAPTERAAERAFHLGAPVDDPAWRLNRELCALLVWLSNPELGELNSALPAKPAGAPSFATPIANPGADIFPGRKPTPFQTELGRPVIEKTLALMDAAPSQEEQIHYALCLRWAHGWTPEQRVRYFRWFHEKASRFTGGNSFAKFVEAIRADAASRVPEADRAALVDWLRPVDAPTPAAALKPRAFVKAWTLPELEAALDNLKDRKPDLVRGKDLYTQAQCAQCHLFRDAGGNVGPDLTAVAQRFGRHDILEAMTDPGKVVSDQYAMVTLTVLDGKGGTSDVSGLVKEETSATITILTDPLAGKTSNLYKNVVVKREKAAVSTMPPGLLYTLTAEEVADLLALFGAK